MLLNNLHTFALLAYKQSPYLEDCIVSLQQQTYPSQIIICTSTPSAFLTAIADKYNLKLAVNNQRHGIGADWNYALSQATTKYVSFAHQDDLYYPKYVESCLTAAEDSSDNLITFTDYEEIIGSLTRATNLNLKIKRCLLRFWFIFGPRLQSKLARRYLLALGSPICCPSVMYHRRNLQAFQFSTTFGINLDWEAWLRMAKLPGSFILVDKKLCAHRIHDESETSHGIENNRRAHEDILMFRQLYPEPLARVFARLYAHSYNTNKAS